MNKEEYIYNLLDKLDLDEWCTDLYKVPLTWCELYDIRDYINSLKQENKQLKERVDYLERSNNRREDEILFLRQELNDSEDCREKALEYLDKEFPWEDGQPEDIYKILKGE